MASVANMDGSFGNFCKISVPVFVLKHPVRKIWKFGLPRVPFVNCCQFMYLVICLLVLRAEFGI